MFVLLCVLLLVWQPFSFASELIVTLPSIDMRGLPAAIELAAHAVVAALSVAAAVALWDVRPHGRALAAAALIASAIAGVQRLYWSVLPTQTPPGDELPLAILVVAHSAAWLVYLFRR